MNEFKIIRTWSSGRLKFLLVKKMVNDAVFKPGDLVSIGDLKLPILDISRVSGGYKFTVSCEEELPKAEFIEIINVKPKAGAVSVIGELPKPVISFIRQNGYEVHREVLDSAKLVILTNPITPKLPKDKKILIAPNPYLSLQDYHYLNELLASEMTGVSYNLNKPLTLNNSVTVDVSYFARKIFIPKNIHGYSLKVKGGVSISSIGDRWVILAIGKKHNILVSSSITIFYPFEIILGKGENGQLLLDILESEVKINTTVEEEGAKEIEVESRKMPNEFYIELKGLPEDKAFNFILNHLVKLGGIVTDRNDSLKKANVSITFFNSPRANFTFMVRGNKAIVGSQDELDEERYRTFRSLITLIEALVNELNDENLRLNMLKLLIRIMSQADKMLITVKDMIELDINAGEIRDELRQLTSIIKKGEPLKSLASEIEDYVTNKLMKVDPLKPLSNELKLELSEKIEKWYEDIPRLIEGFIEK